jgi:shikimate kinase
MLYLLIGILGSGKSRVGKLLAKKLGYEFVEMEELILENIDFKTVHEVYDYRPSIVKRSS